MGGYTILTICKACGVEKPLHDFYKNSRTKSGHSLSKCKECVKIAVRSNPNEINYYRSEKGVIRTIYKTQKANSKRRGHGELPYSKDELKDWLYDNCFSEMYGVWVLSGFDNSLKPSVDRINSLLPYQLSNMRLVTWEENRKAQAEDILNATGSSGRRCKPVYKVNEDGVVVGEYISLAEASRVEGFEIWNLLVRKNRDRNGCYWFYK